MLWSSFILNEVILGAHFNLFVSDFLKGATLKAKLFFINFVLQCCMKILKAFYLFFFISKYLGILL